MHKRFTDEARRAMVIAELEARGLNHAYIGTEHILLGLIHDGAGVTASILRTLNLDASRIRHEIEQLVCRGPEVVRGSELHFTPRAVQAIEMADEDASFLQQDRIGPEHLFFGLLREQEGIAGQVLLGLGLKLDSASKCMFKYRLMQLKLVERVVRPVRAGTPRKRKMREELLAHLTAIYDEALAHGGNPATAMELTATRFGEPAELSRELQDALPVSERVRHYFERWCGWRAPETGTRWMARLAVQLFCLLATMSVLVGSFAIAEFGSNANAWTTLRPIVAFALLLPIVEFLLGTLYFKVRDAIFGVFGSRKSWLRPCLLGMLMGLVVFLAGLSFLALSRGVLIVTSDLLISCTVAGIATACTAVLVARTNGPTEIRDTLWACLDIDGASRHGDPTVEPAS